MVTLQQIINQIEGLEGYVYHFMRYKDSLDLTQYYKIYISNQGFVTCYEVRILVLNEGEPDEAAYIYDIPKEIDPRTPGTFEQSMLTLIENYKSNNPELEYYDVSSVDEVNQVARITGYYLNVENRLETKRYIAFMDGENIKFRELE